MPGSLRFLVPGQPVPSARPRTYFDKRLQRIVTIKLDKNEAYEDRVKACAQIAANAARWVIPPPKVLFALTLHIYRGAWMGDGDNFAKSLTDPLKGVIWADDRYVTEWHIRLFIDKANPRVDVGVMVLPSRDEHRRQEAREI